MRAKATLALLASTASLIVAASASAGSSPPPRIAVKMLNEWRAKTGAAAVIENEVKSASCAKHANYVRLNKTTGHYETAGRPGYSEAGHQAAASSVLSYSKFSYGPFDWEGAIYHRMSLLNPRLTETGFWAEFSHSCMNVFGTSSLMTTPTLTAYPYPYDGQTSVATTFNCNEVPNPCDAIPGNRGDRPTGFILSALFNGPWSWADGAVVASASLKPDRGSTVPVAIQDGDHARGEYLDGGFAMIPERRLKPSTWYTASASGSVRGSVFGDNTNFPFTVNWRFKTQARHGDTSEGIVNFDLLGRLEPPPITRFRYRSNRLKVNWRHSTGAVKYRTKLGAYGRTIRKTMRGTSVNFDFTYRGRGATISIQAVSRTGRVSRATRYRF